jgi:formylglycine-generating enzyme required for sulfatase activity
MAKKDVPDPGRRTLLEAIARDMGGFFRRLREELNAPSAREQELAAIQERLDEIQARLDEIQARLDETEEAVEEHTTDHQKILDELSKTTEEMFAMKQFLTPKEVPLWKATLRKLWDLIVAYGLVKTVDAMHEAWVQEEVYPPFRETLELLKDQIEEVFGPSEQAAAAEPTPTPTEPAPTSTPEPTPEPVEAPKSRPGTWLEPELILIPAGRFIMGSDKTQDPQARDGEFPQHQVYVGNFYIAKYPVTNAEYRRFVDTTGHRKPYHWESEDLKSFRGADQPVTGVTWRDANAYCNWLSGMTGKSYRLPTEAEWEKAARGTDGRIYPWGNQWDAKRCNSREGGPSRTTPVGQYSPQGDSPYGCVDMAGNVWEWTSSVYKSYPYDPKDGREDPRAGDDIPRVLRGGAFTIDGRFVRCACRNWDFPDYWNWYFGFRVCVAPGFL